MPRRTTRRATLDEVECWFSGDWRERVQQGCLPSVISYPTLSPNFSLGPCRWPPLWSVTRAGAAAHHPKSAVPTTI
jgi:hypothetical protein